MTLDHAEDVRFLHDQPILTVDDDFGARPFAEQHTHPHLDLKRAHFPAIIDCTWADGQNLALDRLFLGRIRNDYASGRLFLDLHALQQHAVVQWLELGSHSLLLPMGRSGHRSGIVEFGQLAERVLGGARQHELVTLIVDCEARIRDGDETTPEAQEAAHRNDSEQYLIIRRDYQVVNHADLFVLVVLDCGADQATGAIGLCQRLDVDCNQLGCTQGESEQAAPEEHRCGEQHMPPDCGPRTSDLRFLAHFRSRLLLDQSHGLTVIWLSTLATPGAVQATRSASSRAAHERTVPRKVTLFPSDWTSIRFASNSAFRRYDSSILRLISVGGSFGSSTIRSRTLLTPRTRRTACAALAR